jgi:Gpi18-like mannosyltransferase
MMELDDLNCSVKRETALALVGHRLKGLWQAVSYPVILYIGLRLLLFLFGYFGMVVLATKQGDALWSAFYGNQFLDGWVRWDSGWYSDIVAHGYSYHPLPDASNVAFFPLYPITAKLLDFIFNNVYTSVLTAANLEMLAAMILLYRLLVEFFPAVDAKKALMLLFGYPFAFFFATAYSESLFLLTVVGTFYFGEKRQWMIAALFALAASATRVVGVVMGPVLLIMYLQSIGWSWRRIRPDIGWLVLSPLGVAGFFAYLWFMFGDPLLNIRVESAWNMGFSLEFGRHRELINQLISGNIVNGGTPLIPLVALIMGTIFLLLALVAFGRIKLPYAIYSLGVLLIPYCTTNIDSLGRFTIVAFPIFIMISLWLRDETVTRFVLLANAMFLALFIVLFTHWYWIV